MHLRAQLNELGLKQFERLPLLEVREKKKKSKSVEEENEQECEVCRTPCYVSMVGFLVVEVNGTNLIFIYILF